MSTHIVLLLASILLLLSLSFTGGAAADTTAAPPADCTTQVLSLADCLSFVMAGSQVAKPEGTCCPGLKTVLKSHAECLCEAFKNSAQFGVTLNVSKALSLPAACHVSAPSVSNCGLSLVTGDAPAPAPVGAMSPTFGLPISPAPGSTEAAAPQPASSGSIAVAFPMGFVVIWTLAVSFAF